jgi:hypothetical protein
MPSEHRIPESKDAQDVDRLLRQLSVREGGVPSPGPGARAMGSGSPAVAEKTPSVIAAWGWVSLGGVLAAALTQWPYATCGIPLAVYMAGVGLVLLTGVWASLTSWRLRLGLAHTLAILLLFVGTTLAAYQVLPRIGYAAVTAAWTCGG